MMESHIPVKIVRTERGETVEQFSRLMQGGVWYQTESTFERALIL